jgi:hypothetical protein
MPSVISAGTTAGTAIAITGDTTGNLAFQTNGTTTAMTIDTAQNVKFKSSISVGDATPTTSGAGITFPATQSASSDANTLDDYEEGTWTPTFGQAASNPTITYSTRTGFYVKVGTLVTVICRVSISTTAGGSGHCRITGLPFACASAPEAGIIPMQATNNSGSSNRYLSLYFVQNQSYTAFYGNDPTSNFTAFSNYVNGFDMIFTASYYAS